MPSCQAINCTNTRGKCAKSFFEIPDPTKSKEKRKLCKLWIDHLRNDKLKLETFVYNRNKVVCEDHFEPHYFERNEIAESLGFKAKKKTLKPGAIPTIVKPGLGVPAVNKKERSSTKSLIEKRKKAQMQEHVKVSLKEIPSHQMQAAKKAKQSHDSEIPSTSATSDVISDFSDEAIPLPHETIHYLSTSQQDLLPCGHVCEVCLRLQGNKNSSFVADHSYSQRQYDNSNMSDQQDSILSTNVDLSDLKMSDATSSTPVKTFNNPVCLDDSYTCESETYTDNRKDPDYVFDINSETDESEHDDCNMSTITHEQSYIKENKYIVFESAIENLIMRLKCNECKCPVDPEDIVKDLSDGTSITYNVYCTSGHLIIKWNSQPLIGKMPVGNLLVSASTLFSGQTFSHISQFAEFLHLKFISHTTFDKIQRQCLMPVVKHAWSTFQNVDLEKVRSANNLFRLAGDGRCDSPGFSAKYCTYSLLDIETQRVCMFVIVKVSETGSSSKMEVVGFRRCMNFLLDQGFEIAVLATDRHVQIRSIMGKEYSNTEHQFDVWHLTKSIKKKLVQKAKTKGCEHLSLWIKAVCNHLWWCASNCNGDKEFLEESWISICYHIVNVHTFDGKHITACAHEPISEELSLKKKWLEKDSKAHKALKEVVLDKRLRKDIRQLSEFCHTGSLEVYHSLMLKYVPKRQEFDSDQMWTRTALAAMDHNFSQNRGHKINKDGEKAYKLVCPKATGKWIAKPIYNAKSYQWVYAMMENVLVQKETMALIVKKRDDEGNIAPVPKPSKSELVMNLCSRFKKS